VTNCNQVTGIALHHYLNPAEVLIAAEINHDRVTDAPLRQLVNGDTPNMVGHLRLNLSKPLDGLSN